MTFCGSLRLKNTRSKPGVAIRLNVCASLSYSVTPGLEALEEEPLAVVAEVRNDEQRDVVASARPGWCACRNRIDSETSRSPTTTQSADGALQGVCAAAASGPAAAAICEEGRVVRRVRFMVVVAVRARAKVARCAALFQSPRSGPVRRRSKLLRKCTPGDQFVMNPTAAYGRPHSTLQSCDESCAARCLVSPTRRG